MGLGGGSRSADGGGGGGRPELATVSLGQIALCSGRPWEAGLKCVSLSLSPSHCAQAARAGTQAPGGGDPGLVTGVCRALDCRTLVIPGEFTPGLVRPGDQSGK